MQCQVKSNIFSLHPNYHVSVNILIIIFKMFSNMYFYILFIQIIGEF